MSPYPAETTIDSGASSENVFVIYNTKVGQAFPFVDDGCQPWMFTKQENISTSTLASIPGVQLAVRKLSVAEFGKSVAAWQRMGITDFKVDPGTASATTLKCSGVTGIADNAVGNSCVNVCRGILTLRNMDSSTFTYSFSRMNMFSELMKCVFVVPISLKGDRPGPVSDDIIHITENAVQVARIHNSAILTSPRENIYGCGSYHFESDDGLVSGMNFNSFSVVPVTSKANNISFIPAFTDFASFEAVFGRGTYRVGLCSVLDLLQKSDESSASGSGSIGIAVNPGSLEYMITDQALEDLKRSCIGYKAPEPPAPVTPPDSPESTAESTEDRASVLASLASAVSGISGDETETPSEDEGGEIDPLEALRSLTGGSSAAPSAEPEDDDDDIDPLEALRSLTGGSSGTPSTEPEDDDDDIDPLEALRSLTGGSSDAPSAEPEDDDDDIDPLEALRSLTGSSSGTPSAEPEDDDDDIDPLEALRSLTGSSSGTPSAEPEDDDDIDPLEALRSLTGGSSGTPSTESEDDSSLDALRRAIDSAPTEVDYSPVAGSSSVTPPPTVGEYGGGSKMDTNKKIKLSFILSIVSIALALVGIPFGIVPLVFSLITKKKADKAGELYNENMLKYATIVSVITIVLALIVLI